MNLKIDTSDKKTIVKSFDRIAKDILTTKGLQVNDKIIHITEIEFYFFFGGIHEDNYTHEHKRDENEWRFHNQGLDITLQSGDKMDGGILLRGVLIDGEYINGPRNVVKQIFECFSKVTELNTLKLVTVNEKPLEIIKTFRHIPNKIQDENFHNSHYRYLVNLDNLKLPNSKKEEIRSNCVNL